MFCRCSEFVSDGRTIHFSANANDAANMAIELEAIEAVSNAPWGITLTDSFLIEKFPSKAYVLGRWGYYFGAWEIRGGNIQESAPAWAPHSSTCTTGEGLDDFDFPDDSDILQEYCDGSRRYTQFTQSFWGRDYASWSKYWREIPDEVIATAASAPDVAWHRIEAVWDSADCSFYEKNKLAALIQHNNHYLALTRKSRGNLHQLLPIGAEQRILRHILGRKYARRVERMLDKLDIDVWSQALARAIVLHCCSDTDFRILSQARWLSSAVLVCFDLVPRWLRQPYLIESLANYGERVGTLLEVINNYGSAIDLPFIAMLRSAIESQANVDTTLACLNDYVEQRARRYVIFPPSPISPTVRLQPITSISALEREGVEMKNCISSYWSDIHAGRAYALRWMGSRPATILIVRRPSKWVVSEIRERGNKEPSKKIQRIIKHSIAEELQRQNSHIGR